MSAQQILSSGHCTDALAVWECYCDAPYLLTLLPTEGAWEHRQYVLDEVTPLCNLWWQYVAMYLGYCDSYDWEFVPTFLSALPTHDVEALTLADIGVALRAVIDSSLNLETPL